MTNILLCGCNGKMGQVITRLASQRDDLKIAAGYDINNFIANPYPVFNSLDSEKIDAPIDVIIDFSNPDALEAILKFAMSKKLPVVIATTGLSQNHTSMLESASSQIPVFFSANMSLGVNLLINLATNASKVLEGAFDIEIVEKHHNQKIDAPSGTALAIADAINSALVSKQEYVYDRHSRRKKRSKNEIGIHAVRGGTIVGEHQVIFAGNDEIIELKHIAMSKDIFAAGALRVALFMLGKQPRLYDMSDFISSEFKKQHSRNGGVSNARQACYQNNGG